MLITQLNIFLVAHEFQAYIYIYPISEILIVRSVLYMWTTIDYSTQAKMFSVQMYSITLKCKQPSAKTSSTNKSLIYFQNQVLISCC